MGSEEVNRIIKELHELRKEFRESIKEICECLNTQNERIISTEKDFQYLEEKTRERDDQLLRDVNEFFLRFREFKVKGVPDLIEQKLLKLQTWFLVTISSAAIGIIGFFIYQFIIKRVQ